MTTVYIAEKPSMGKTIAARLNPVRSHGTHVECAGGVFVTWCFGHLYEQVPPEGYNPEDKVWNMDRLPIVPTVWKLEEKKESKPQIRAIKELLAKATLVVHAGDADPEGELLVHEVLEQLKYKGAVKRLWVQALDDTSLNKALAAMKPASETYPLKLAAESRSRADWLIGMNLTRAYTMKFQGSGGQGVLSVGRVQTPTLSLVVQRDLSIENFKARDYFEVFGTIQTGASTLQAKWLSPAEGAGIDEEGRVIDKNVALAVVNKVSGKSGTVSEFTSQKQSQGAPLPFSLSAIQIAASAKWGMSAKTVLDTCQALYETHKLTTYPRSDCQYLPESMLGDAPTVLKALASSYPTLAGLVAKADVQKKSACFNDKKISAHHAIIPTPSGGNTSKLSKDEAQIYDLICRHYVAQFYPNHEYLQNSAEFTVQGEVFKATGRQVTKTGWKEVFGALLDEDTADAVDSQAIPTMSKGDGANCVKAQVEAKKTKPPARFTEGTLIQAMTNIHTFVANPEIKKLLKESAGIGTEATRAGIIETLKARDFLDVKGKQLLSSAKAKVLIAALPDVLTKPDLTAIFEQRLEEIRTSKTSPVEFLAKQVGFVTLLVEKAKKSDDSLKVEAAHKCPDCNKGLRRISSKKGFFWGCTGYADGCKFSTDDIRGKPVLKGAKAGASAAPAKKSVFRKK